MSSTHTPRELFEKQKLVKQAVKGFIVEYESGAYEYAYTLLQHKLESLTELVKEVNREIKSQ